VIGGALITAIVVWGQADRYIGLGIPVIVQAFEQPLAPWDFAAKGAMTVLSLGFGFKGGEVTPLFYIGATLGNALAPVLDQPLGLMAALGFVAVFAGAANTPLACTLMAMELFGWQIAAFAAVACTVSYFFSGHTSIYKAQRHVRRPWLRPAVGSRPSGPPGPS
jgi:H+/Cl- antiporter ClcA